MDSIVRMLNTGGAWLRCMKTGVGVGLALVVLAGCSNDSSSPQNSELDQLNAALEQQLVQAAGGKGLAFFTMPESNNFAAIPQDPRNPLSKEKVELGKFLYHETVLLTKPKSDVGMHTGSCASCHHAEAGFQANMAQGIGEGGWGFGMAGENRVRDPQCAIELLDVQPIRSPSAMNAAWQTNILWNGQFGATGVNVGTESQWTKGTPKENNELGYEGLETQAIAGQDVHRLNVDLSGIAQMESYRTMFAAAFPGEPAETRISRVNAGLAIAAYERTLLSNRAPFQQWLRGNRNAMTAQQVRGATLFFGKAQCASCHTGPTLNSMAFYALGMKNLDGPGTYGTDASKPEHKGRGGFTGKAEDMHKFKVPQLYNLADSRFYGHGASFTSVRDVIVYKNNAVPENADVPLTQLAVTFKPLNLTDREIDDMTAFVEQSLRDPDLQRYVPSALPSGLCFPNNDTQSRKDRGCE